MHTPINLRMRPVYTHMRVWDETFIYTYKPLVQRREPTETLQVVPSIGAPSGQRGQAQNGGPGIRHSSGSQGESGRMMALLQLDSAWVWQAGTDPFTICCVFWSCDRWALLQPAFFSWFYFSIYYQILSPLIGHCFRLESVSVWHYSDNLPGCDTVLD